MLNFYGSFFTLITCDSAYRLQSYAWSRLNVVSVLTGYRFLEKFMFSFQTLHVLCELRKFLPKYRIMWPMPSYLFWNLAIFFSNSSLGSEKLNQNRHSLIKSRLTDLNNFKSRASFRMILSDLWNNQCMTWSIARSLCNSWAACQKEPVNNIARFAPYGMRIKIVQGSLYQPQEQISDVTTSNFLPRLRVSETFCCEWRLRGSDIQHVMFDGLLRSVRKEAGWRRFGVSSSQTKHVRELPMTSFRRQYRLAGIPQVLDASTGRSKAALTKSGRHRRGVSPW